MYETIRYKWNGIVNVKVREIQMPEDKANKSELLKAYIKDSKGQFFYN